MLYFQIYLIIGCLLGIWAYVRNYRGMDIWTTLICIFIWPIVILAALLPDDPED